MGMVVADSIIEYIKMMCKMITADIDLDDYKGIGRRNQDTMDFKSDLIDERVIKTMVYEDKEKQEFSDEL